MSVDLGEPPQEDLSRGERPEQSVDHDDREAADQEVQSVGDVERQGVPDRPLKKHEDAEGGHHGAQGRRQAKPVAEQQADEDPQQRHRQVEEQERRGTRVGSRPTPMALIAIASCVSSQLSRGLGMPMVRSR